MPAVNPQVRIDTVDTAGKVTKLSYFDGGAWTSATANASQGPTVFSLGGTFAGFSVTVADNAKNVANDQYTAVGSAMVAGDPALVSYTVTPAPDATGTSTPSTPVYSMKDANPAVSGFAMLDGVTADIETNSNNSLTKANTYTFRLPPRFTLANGVEVSIDPNSNNQAKDAYTFHMPQSTEHTAASLTAGPDMDWLSDKGLGDLSAVHDQILSASVEVGTRASMYEMAGNMLDDNNTTLTAVMSSNEDLDMAKAIIDLKTAENSYQATLSYGSRVMPVSLVDFLK
jgi:flagellin-like hook-associated protein FlgL